MSQPKSVFATREIVKVTIKYCRDWSFVVEWDKKTRYRVRLNCLLRIRLMYRAVLIGLQTENEVNLNRLPSKSVESNMNAEEMKSKLLYVTK